MEQMYVISQTTYEEQDLASTYLQAVCPTSESADEWIMDYMRGMVAGQHICQYDQFAIQRMFDSFTVESVDYHE